MHNCTVLGEILASGFTYVNFYCSGCVPVDNWYVVLEHDISLGIHVRPCNYHQRYILKPHWYPR